MRFDRIILEDFGRHKYLEADTPGNAVGITGPNGAGKTTIRQAVQLLLTGGIDSGQEESPPLNTYIRNFGLKDGPKSARVTGFFTQHGQSGKIVRRITKSAATRELTWGVDEEGKDVVYTKAAEVTEVLKTIMSADKRAVSSLVCLKQGALDNMFTGSAGQRTELYGKLVMTEHLQKARSSLTGFIKNIKNGLPDLTSLIDQAEDALQAQETLVASSKTALDSLPNREEHIAIVSTIATELQAARRLEQELAELHTRKAGIEIKNPDEVARLQGELADCQARIEEAKNLTEKAEQLTSSIASAKRCKAAAKAKNLAYMKKQSGLSEDAYHAAVKAREEKNGLEGKLIRDRTERDRLEKVVAEDTQNVANATASLEKKEPVYEREFAALTTARESYQELNSRLTAKESSLTFLSSALQHQTHADGSVCLACFQPITDMDAAKRGRTILEEEVAQLKLDVAEAKKNGKALGETVDQLSREIGNLRATNQAAVTALATNEPRLEQFKKAVIESDAQWKAFEGRDLDGDIASYETADREWNVALAAYQALADYQALVNDIPKMEAALYDAQTKLADRDNLPTALLESITQILETNVSNTAKLEEIAAQERSIGQRAEESGKQLQAAQADPLLEELDLPDDMALGEGYFDNLLTELRNAQEEVVRARATLKANQDSSRAASERLGELEDRRSRQEAQFELLGELERLHGALSNDGISMDYMNYLFDHIAIRTQEHLTATQAEFVVSPCPDKPLAFDFTRTDDPSGNVMYQSKLSGAQAVRLSLAVVFSIHDLIIPEVGMVFLDEPTTHLNETNILHLQELLCQLSEQDSHRQMFISDHSPLLSPAFDCKIELSGEFQ